MTIFKKIITNILKSLIGIVFSIPFFWMFISSFKSTSEILTNPLGIPQDFNFENYIYAWETANFNIYFLNSVVVVLSSLIIFLSSSSYVRSG